MYKEWKFMDGHKIHKKKIPTSIKMIISVNKDFVGLSVQKQARYCIIITSESVKGDF